MDINRHNYESFFILYMDNELDAAGRQAVEAFIALHPDLKEELDLLQQFKLIPDTTIQFTGKESLYMPETELEEQLLLYTDQELDAAGIQALEKQAAANPALQKELELFGKTRLIPEPVEFPDKASLYRWEENLRPITFKWWRAAAAVFLLGGGLTAALLMNRKETTDGLAGNTGIKNSKPANPENRKTETLKYSTGKVNEAVIIPDQAIAGIPVKQPTDRAKAVQPDKLPSDRQVVPPVAVKNDAPLVAQQDIRRDNNLPKPDQNPNVISQQQVDGLMATGTPVAKNPEANNKSFTTAAVTTAAVQPSDITTVKYNPDDVETGKKSKLRGLLRKVTRTFEKRTNIDPTDEDNRLLVGGLSIKLK